MDAEPPVGDDLNRMLVSMKQEVLQRAAQEPPAKPRPWARRHLGLTLGLVALLGLGGATGALALVLPSPFEASAPATTAPPEPSAAPEATPSPTSRPVTPAPRPASPPAVPIDCATLASRLDLSDFVLDAAPVPQGSGDPQDDGISQRQAALRQVGAVDCHFAEDAEPYRDRQVTTRISPAVERGREWISGLRASGLGDLGVDGVSAYTCSTGTYPQCNTSSVSGDWWIETSVSGYDDGSGSLAGDPAAQARLVEAVRAVLADTSPAAPWSVPETIWSTGGCAAVSSADVAGLRGDDRLRLAESQTQPPETGIDRTQVAGYSCDWLLPQVEYQEGDTFGVYLRVLPGAGWAVEDGSVSGTPVAVAGATAARYACVSLEGQSCWVDASTGGSWVTVMTDYDTSPEHQALVVRLAEEIIAARARG